MYCRQFKSKEFKHFFQTLKQKAQQNPLEASYNLQISFNDTQYILKLQPDYGYVVTALQALKIKNEDCGQTYQLITDNLVLSSLLELFIVQEGKVLCNS